jgi:hypothetical protein
MLILNLATKFKNVYQKSYNLTKFISMSKNAKTANFLHYFIDNVFQVNFLQLFHLF